MRDQVVYKVLPHPLLGGKNYMLFSERIKNGKAFIRFSNITIELRQIKNMHHTKLKLLQ